MLINTKGLFSVSEANQNFSKVTRKVDEDGAVVILKNNRPRYVVVDFALFEQLEAMQDVRIDEIADRLLQENHAAFEALAE